MSPGYRGSTVGSVIHQWMEMDPEEVEQWLDDSTMPDMEKKRYRELLERTRKENP